MVFPCLQVALGLSCLMGLVMFACYGGNSPLDKQYVTSKDQVSVTKVILSMYNGANCLHLSHLKKTNICDVTQ